MTNHRTIQPHARKVIVGVDTHKHVHVAVAIDTWGIRLGDRSCAADSDGYQQLITWAERHGRVAAFGIEGTGSYGAGLARAVRRAGHQVLEVNRGDRRTRRIAGKSDTVDAETAARSVLAGQSTAIPKTADGAVEMMRHLKVARRTAVNARTSAMITLKQIVVTAPPELRETLHPLADQALLKRCRGWRCGTIDTPTASAKHTLRALARRWFALSVEIVDHDRHLGRLTTQTSPTLREGLGIGADTAAEMLIIFGDNPDRIHSEAAFAKLCGACPIPASSGMTTGRHRLYRGGHRQANAALHRAVIVRMRYHSPTLNDVERRTAEGRPKREIIRCLKGSVASFGITRENPLGGPRYAANPNTLWISCVCPTTSPFAIHRACPLRSACMISMPRKVRHAVVNRLKPSIGRVRRLMNRWSCSMMLFRYLHWRRFERGRTSPSCRTASNATG